MVYLPNINNHKKEKDMTTKKFADFIEKQARSILNVSAEPIFGEYILTRNGKKIGVLYQNQCYLFLTDKAKELLPDAKVCRPYKYPPGEPDFILVEDTTNQELLCSLFKATYDKFYAWQDLFYDFSGIFSFNKGFMNDIERLYNNFVVLLSSSWENGFLKVRPIDTKGRIIKLEFRRRDLTPEGEKYFFPFSHKFILYTDRTLKTPSEKLIKKWLDEVRNE